VIGVQPDGEQFSHRHARAQAQPGPRPVGLLGAPVSGLLGDRLVTVNGDRAAPADPTDRIRAKRDPDLPHAGPALPQRPRTSRTSHNRHCRVRLPAYGRTQEPVSGIGSGTT
jgi:hypothetical protein